MNLEGKFSSLSLFEVNFLLSTSLALLIIFCFCFTNRLWSGVTAAINANDLDAATEAKSIVEDSQRETTKARDESGKKWAPRFFAMKDGEHRPNFS